VSTQTLLAALTNVPALARLPTRSNGDKLFPGRSILLDPKRTPKFEMLLDLLSVELQPKFGAVLKLFRARTFIEVLDLRQIEEGDTLVAAGRGAIKKYNYERIQDFKEREETYVAPDLDQMKEPAPAAESRVKEIEVAHTYIFVANGDESGAEGRVLLKPSELRLWTRVLEKVTEKLAQRLLHGDVKRIFLLEGGEEIHSGTQLEEHVAYVAVDRMPLKPPPFRLGANGQLEHLPARKVRLTALPKIEPRTRVPKATAAFFRTGTGLFTPNYPHQAGSGLAALPTSVAHLQPHHVPSKGGFNVSPGKSLHGARPLPAIGVSQEAASAAGTEGGKLPSAEATAARLGSGISRISADYASVDGDAPSGAASQPQPVDDSVAAQSRALLSTFSNITASHEAADAVDIIVAFLKQNPRLDEDTVDRALLAMQRRIRDRLYEHRQQSPEVTTAFDESVNNVLNFMLQPPDGDAERTPEAIQERFEPMVQAALGGRLAHWESTPSSLVALVILLDQFPRSMYRGDPDMYIGDSMARAVVLRALYHSGVMDEVHPVYRLFPCLALSHQEDLEMQRVCLSEWERACEFFDVNDPIREYTKTFTT
jgi:uncharacterized protein (DUF924 family)